MTTAVATIEQKAAVAQKATEKPNIHQRLLAVAQDVGTLAKEGHSEQGYAFHQIDQIMAALRPHLIKHGVLITYSVLPGSKVEAIKLDKTDRRTGEVRELIQCVAECMTEITAWNVDDPADRLTCTAWGQGLNNSDKAAAIAISYALKSWFLAVFSLRGQPDAESHSTQRRASGGGGKSMLSKFASQCASCGGDIAVGDRILYSKEDGARHEACPSPAVAQQEAASGKHVDDRPGISPELRAKLEAWRDDPRCAVEQVAGKKGPVSLQAVAAQLLLSDKTRPTAVNEFLRHCAEHLGEPQTAETTLDQGVEVDEDIPF